MKKRSQNNHQKKPMAYDAVLTAGFGEDDYVEGVFLIEAIAKETFFNRKAKLEAITGFSDGYFDSYEEDEEGGVWKIITSAWFETVGDLKNAMKKMERYKWFFNTNSSILLNGEYLYSDGEWML